MLPWTWYRFPAGWSTAMRRRDFLHPRHLARAAGQFVGALQEARACLEEATAPEAALIHFARRAMATTFEVLLPIGTANALEAACAALDEIDRLEAQLTIYRDDSEVSRLNQRAAEQPVAVEAGLFRLLILARDVTNATAGAFDVTAGALIRVWGFQRRAGRVPPPEELAETLQCVGMEQVVLDIEHCSVRFSRPGILINLGSIGKGYALDRAGQVLRSQDIHGGLLHGGHSSVLALGSEPGQRRGWAVGIRHPWDPARRLATVQLHDRALATSAATFQHFEHEGRKLGHIIDPRTGWPAEGLASATAVAPTAALADALSTAFFILGLDGTRQFCEANSQVGAILLPPGEKAEPVVLNLGTDELTVHE